MESVLKFNPNAEFEIRIHDVKHYLESAWNSTEDY